MKAILFLAALVAFNMSSITHASLQVGSVVKFDTDLPGTYGGRFGITDGGSIPAKAVSPFETFCVEIGEFVADNGVYRVAGISTVTVTGNKSLTNYAAWLYTQFRNGSLQGFDGSTNDSNALQWAFWNQMTYGNTAIDNALPGSPAVGYENLYNAESWLGDYNSDSGWDKSPTYFGSVRITNLESGPLNNPTRHQDQ